MLWITSHGFRLRYTGQQILPEARLYHYKARAYDPVLGTFLQTDPIGSKDDLDLYAYVGDDPINKSDPSGTDGKDSWRTGERAALRVFNTPKACNAWGCSKPISNELRAVQQKQTGITKQISNQNAMELGGYILNAAALAGGIGEARAGMSAMKEAQSIIRVGKAADSVEKFLGKGYKVNVSREGNLRLTSRDGTKQMRFDIEYSHGDSRGPHINVETYQPRNAFPGDREMIKLQNEHIYFDGN